MSKDLALGFEIVRRNLDEPIISSTLDKTNREEREETFYNLYMNWTPNSDWALSTGFYIDVFDGNPDLRADVPNELVTFGVPINTTYFSSTGVFCGFAANMMYQNLKRPSGVILLDGDDEFAVFDASVGYRFPQRRGLISFAVGNVFNKKFKFQDDSFRQFTAEEPKVSRYIPERSFTGRLTVNF